MTKRSEVKRSELSVEEWADKQTFTTTEQIHIPDLMADRVWRTPWSSTSRRRTSRT